MPDTSPQPSTGVEPSAEAKRAAAAGFKANYTTYSGHIHDALTAAYAIDTPAIHAAWRS